LYLFTGTLTSLLNFPRVIVQTRIVTYTQTNGQAEIEKKTVASTLF